jgi:hypothetical protein
MSAKGNASKPGTAKPVKLLGSLRGNGSPGWNPKKGTKVKSN